MSEQQQNNPSMFQGWLPLRRIIALGITLAAILTGVAVASGAGGTQETTYTIIDRNDRIISIRDTDGEAWECVGEVGKDSCVMNANLPGGPAEPLGYKTKDGAAETCTNGSVKALWRRGQVVGYTCLIDWQQSLQGR